jgi:hypothetical protein
MLDAHVSGEPKQIQRYRRFARDAADTQSDDVAVGLVEEADAYCTPRRPSTESDRSWASTSPWPSAPQASLGGTNAREDGSNGGESRATWPAELGRSVLPAAVSSPESCQTKALLKETDR